MIVKPKSPCEECPQYKEGNKQIFIGADNCGFQGFACKSFWQYQATLKAQAETAWYYVDDLEGRLESLEKFIAKDHGYGNPERLDAERKLLKVLLSNWKRELQEQEIERPNKKEVKK